MKDRTVRQKPVELHQTPFKKDNILLSCFITLCQRSFLTLKAEIWSLPERTSSDLWFVSVEADFTSLCCVCYPGERLDRSLLQETRSLNKRTQVLFEQGPVWSVRRRVRLLSSVFYSQTWFLGMSWCSWCFQKVHVVFLDEGGSCQSSVAPNLREKTSRLAAVTERCSQPASEWSCSLHS